MSTKKRTKKGKCPSQAALASIAMSQPGANDNDESHDLVEAVIELMTASGMGPLQSARFLVNCGRFVAQHNTARHTEYDSWKCEAIQLLSDSRWPWPTRNSGPIEGDEHGQTWADVDDWLRARGSSLEERVQQMRREETP